MNREQAIMAMEIEMAYLEKCKGGLSEMGLEVIEAKKFAIEYMKKNIQKGGN